MALTRTCDKCGEKINTNRPLSDDSWVQVAIALDEPARGGNTRDYHRSCARDVTLADVWQRPGLVPL